MTIGDRSDDLMHALYDRREAQAAAIEAEAARVWADPGRLARLIDDAHCPISLYFDLRDALLPEGPKGDAATIEEWADAIRAGRLDALAPADRLRLERYVADRVAAQLGR